MYCIGQEGLESYLDWIGIILQFILERRRRRRFYEVEISDMILQNMNSHMRFPIFFHFVFLNV